MADTGIGNKIAESENAAGGLLHFLAKILHFRAASDRRKQRRQHAAARSCRFLRRIDRSFDGVQDPGRVHPLIAREYQPLYRRRRIEVASLEEGGPGDLGFVRSARYAEALAGSRIGAVIATAEADVGIAVTALAPVGTWVYDADGGAG